MQKHIKTWIIPLEPNHSQFFFESLEKKLCLFHINAQYVKRSINSFTLMTSFIICGRIKKILPPATK